MEHHAHINTFTTESFSYLEERGFKVLSQRLLSPLLTIPAALADATTRTHNPAWKHPGFLTGIYNRLVPLAQHLFGVNAAAAVIRLDGIFCSLFRLHKGLIYLVIKDPAVVRPAACHIAPAEMIRTTVPPLRIREAE